MLCRLDHVNVSVVSIDRAVRFLRVAFPEFRLRGRGGSDHGDWTEQWLHLGTDEVYVCLNQSSILEKADRDPRKTTGINPIGFAVVAVEPLHQRYTERGFKCAPVDEQPSRKRLYVTDADGITWEFIEYLSADPAVRNDYSV